MIILNSLKIKSNIGNKSQNCEFFLKEYENILNFGYLSCPYCHSSQYIRYGFYERNVLFIQNNSLCSKVLKIQRIQCKNCKKTHGLLPDGLVPYKQYNLSIIINSIILWITERKSFLKIEIDQIKQWVKSYRKKFQGMLRTTFPKLTIFQSLSKIKDHEETRKNFVIQNHIMFLQEKFLWINYAPT